MTKKQTTDTKQSIGNQAIDSMKLNHNEFMKFTEIDNLDKVVEYNASLVDMAVNEAITFEVATTMYGRNPLAVVFESSCDAVSKGIVELRKAINVYQTALGKAQTTQNEDGTQNGSDVGRSPKNSEIVEDSVARYQTLIETCEDNIRELQLLGSCFLTIAKLHEGDKEIASAYTRSLRFNDTNSKFDYKKLAKSLKSRKRIGQ